jgi:hypothetical protein
MFSYTCNDIFSFFEQVTALLEGLDLGHLLSRAEGWNTVVDWQGLVLVFKTNLIQFLFLFNKI